MSTDIIKKKKILSIFLKKFSNYPDYAAFDNRSDVGIKYFNWEQPLNVSVLCKWKTNQECSALYSRMHHIYLILPLRLFLFSKFKGGDQRNCDKRTKGTCVFLQMDYILNEIKLIIKKLKKFAVFSKLVFSLPTTRQYC